jgi:hypothetical protein
MLSSTVKKIILYSDQLAISFKRKKVQQYSLHFQKNITFSLLKLNPITNFEKSTYFKNYLLLYLITHLFGQNIFKLFKYASTPYISYALYLHLVTKFWQKYLRIKMCQHFNEIAASYSYKNFFYFLQFTNLARFLRDFHEININFNQNRNIFEDFLFGRSINNFSFNLVTLYSHPQS